MATILEELQAKGVDILERNASRLSGLKKVRAPLSNELLAQIAVLASPLYESAVSAPAKGALEKFAPAEAKLLVALLKKLPKNDKQMTQALLALDEAGFKATRELARAFSAAHREELGTDYLNRSGTSPEKKPAKGKAAKGEKSAKGEKGDTKAKSAELFKAVRAKKIDGVRAALSGGADVNAKKTVNEYPRIRPLHLAVLMTRQETAARLEVAKLLLDSGADVDAVDEDGTTPLHYACGSLGNGKENIHIDVVKLLLDRGAKVDPRNHGNFSPLYEAIGANALDIAELLIERGADLDVVTASGNLMSAACSVGDEATFRFLRKKGASLDVPKWFNPNEQRIESGWAGATGFSLLHLAAQDANLPVVKLLLNEKVPLNSVYKGPAESTLNGKTPLDVALEKELYADAGDEAARCHEVVEVLKLAGAKAGSAKGG